jgi:hypothetical protein
MLHAGDSTLGYNPILAKIQQIVFRPIIRIRELYDPHNQLFRQVCR